jgi:hypothetical protein
MSSIEDLVTSLLQDEAKDAPDVDAFVARILGETEPRRASAREHRWDLRTPVWVVPMTAAAVAALIVLAVAMSSLWLSAGDRDNGVVTPPSTSTTPRHASDSSNAGDHEGRLPGWVSLSSGSVHIEMEADDTERMWWRDWTIGCSLSVLSTVELGDFACAGPVGRQPRYEVMVGSAVEPAHLDSDHITIEGAFIPGVPGGGVGDDSDGLAGQSVEVKSTTSKVRYNCPGSCGEPVERQVTVIGFPDQDAHITILSPIGDGLAWLTDYVYTDPAH